MQVNNTPGDGLRPDAVQKPPTGHPGAGSVSGSQPAEPVVPIAATVRADQVDISDAGRTLAEDPAEETPATASLDPRRIDEIRSKILAGAYHTNEMADQVARAILRSGDL